MVEHTNYFSGPLEASVAAASVLVVAMLALVLLVHRRWLSPSGGLACCQDVGMRRRLPSVATLAETGGSPNGAQTTLPPAPLLLAASSDLGSVYSGEECSGEENRRRMEMEAALLEGGNGGNGGYLFHPAFHWQMQLDAQCHQPLPLNGQIHQSARARHSHHQYRQIVADASLAEKGAVGVCISSSGSTSSEEDKALRHRENRGNSWSGYRYTPAQRMTPPPPPPPLRKHTMDIMEAPLEETNNNQCVVEMQQEVSNGGRCGEIEVAFAYDAPMRKMTVHLLQARVPLSSSSLVNCNRNSSGPHLQVRLLLLPNRKQKHKSRVRNGENPQFMESFLLHRINPEDVNSMGVRFRLYLCERMRRERLGESIVRFSSVCLEAENNVWLELEPRASSAIKMSACDVLSLARSDSTSSTYSVAPPLLVGSCQSGSCQTILPEMFLGLAYNGTTGRLAVELIKGSHLRNLAMTRAPDTYVKLSLLSSTDHELSRSKSSIRRGQPNPLFKETFMFQVALFQLPDVTLMVSVYNKRGIHKKELIGWFSLGLKSSGEAARRHWDDMCEMRGEQLCRWHTLLDC